MDLDTKAKVCRICLMRQDTLFSLYRSPKSGGASPYYKLMSKTNLKIESNDAGPSSICSQCLIDLDTTVTFLDRCERSNRTLAAITQRREDSPRLNVINTSIVKLESDVQLEPEPLVPPTTVINSHLPHKDSDKDVKASNETVDSEKCPECGSSNDCEHRKPQTSYSCTHCDKIFKKKYNFQIHLKRHSGAREWSCGACGAAQVSASLARRHCRPAPRRACPDPACRKTFTNTTNLSTHLRSHTGERPFECHDCGKKFGSKKILRCHIRIHTGEKPYMCPVCGARFTSNHLSTHMRKHAGGAAGGAGGAGVPAAPAEHACARCPRLFPSGAALRSHARTHSSRRQFTCALCTAAYKFKQSLNRHVKTTHGVLTARQ